MAKANPLAKEKPDKHDARHKALHEENGPFVYENGYILRISKPGNVFVMLQLTDDKEQSAGIVLPPEVVAKLKEWL